MSEQTHKNQALFSAAVGSLASLLHRVHTTGLDNLPPEGQGAVLSTNHDSFIDAPLIVSQIPNRFVRLMAQGKIMEMPIMGPLMKAIGARGVPSVQGRSKDPDASEKTLAQLSEFARSGEFVLVLPEGHVKYWNQPYKLHQFHTGAVRIAAAAGVPIIPGGLFGTLHTLPVFEIGRDKEAGSRYGFLPLWLPAKIRLHFGEPLWINPRAASEKDLALQETKRLKQRVETLWTTLRTDSPTPFVW